MAVPGAGAQGAAAPMEEIDVVFEADSSQVFRIGEPFVPVKMDGTIYLRPPGD